MSNRATEMILRLVCLGWDQVIEASVNSILFRKHSWSAIVYIHSGRVIFYRV
jgi:hypothetical protein